MAGKLPKKTECSHIQWRFTPAAVSSQVRRPPLPTPLSLMQKPPSLNLNASPSNVQPPPPPGSPPPPPFPTLPPMVEDGLMVSQAQKTSPSNIQPSVIVIDDDDAPPATSNHDQQSLRSAATSMVIEQHQSREPDPIPISASPPSSWEEKMFSPPRPVVTEEEMKERRMKAKDEMLKEWFPGASESTLAWFRAEMSVMQRQAMRIFVESGGRISEKSGESRDVKEDDFDEANTWDSFVLQELGYTRKTVTLVCRLQEALKTLGTITTDVTLKVQQHPLGRDITWRYLMLHATGSNVLILLHRPHNESNDNLVGFHRDDIMQLHQQLPHCRGFVLVNLTDRFTPYRSELQVEPLTVEYAAPHVQKAVAHVEQIHTKGHDVLSQLTPYTSSVSRDLHSLVIHEGFVGVDLMCDGYPRVLYESTNYTSSGRRRVHVNTVYLHC